MNRVNKVERCASQGTPVTEGPGEQLSSIQRVREGRDGAGRTMRTQVARDTERFDGERREAVDGPLTTTLRRKSSPSLGRKDSSSDPASHRRDTHRATRCSTVPGAPFGDQENAPDAGRERRKVHRVGSLVDDGAVSATPTRRSREAKQLPKNLRRRSMEISVQPRDALDRLRGVLKVVDPTPSSNLREKIGNAKLATDAPRVHVREGASLAEHERLTPKQGTSPAKYAFRNPQVGSPRRVKQIPINVEKQQPSKQASATHPPQPPTLLQIANSLLAMERHTENFERAQRGEASTPPPKKQY